MKKINAKEFLELDETAFHDVTFRSGDVIKIHIEDLYKIMEQYHQSKVNNVVSDDVMQTLPKRLSNSAYIRAKHSSYQDFMEWWDKQV
jgi:hypothetical protein